MVIEEGEIWDEYLGRFDYFSRDAIRRHNEPRRYLHRGGSEKAVVLIHGLTDSPYTMGAIGRYFHKELGYDVYLPLLQKHGLKDPRFMKGVSLPEWKKNVQFAVETAAGSSPEVSIGGLSTGGALGFNFACTHPAVNSSLYLFSAAFRLYGGPGDRFSRFLEVLLTTRLSFLFTSSKPLIGENPYRYARVPFNSARELIILMRENDALLDHFFEHDKCDKKIFSAWSEDDTVVSVNAIKKLSKITSPKRYQPFAIPKEKEVPHACVVLQEPIHAVGAPSSVVLEPANPCFDKMMAKIKEFGAAK
jgi:esterase/lipase